jgi:hypothetical protein
VGIPDTFPRIDINSVFVIRSTDDGRTWSDSILVSRSKLKAAFWPQLLIDSFERYHIIWFKAIYDWGIFPLALYHASSIDGITWTPEANVTQAFGDTGFFSFDYAPDGWGRLHLVGEANNRIYYFVYSNNSWSEATPISVPGTILEVELEISASGILHLVWIDGDSISGGVYHSERSITLAVEDARRYRPKAFTFHPNFPNPFNPSTQMQFDLPEASSVSLNVFDVLGRKVASLVEGEREAGSHTAVWSAETFASGVYFARFVATNLRGDRRYLRVNKLLLAK